MNAEDWKNIQNVIFDFGGVLLNIDYQATYDLLSKLIGTDFNFSQYKQADLFSEFECGFISNDLFRDGIRAISSKNELSDEQIDQAWNAMLGNLPQKRIDLVKKISEKRRVFLLSNTNAIHKKAIDPVLSQSAVDGDFEGIFEKVYWSHLIGMRKPDAEIFTHVIKENNLDPKTTLFIDDSPQHVEGAAKVGLKSFHLKSDIETIEWLWEDRT